MADQASVDRLSDLPLGIIHDILTRVPIENAIQTCVLSKQWRYTWTTLPNLRFNYIDDGANFTENFITNALLRHQGPIHTAKLSHLSECSIDSVKEWVLCMSRKNIRDFEIGFSLDRDDAENSLGSSIFSCTKLTKLVIWNLKMDPPLPSFKGFLFLTCLFLARVRLSREGVQRIVGNAPLLKEFTTLFCPNSQLRFRSPNLTHLQVVGHYADLPVYAPLLLELYVGLTWSQFRRESSVCNYTSFLGGFTNLTELIGFDYFTKYLSIGIQPYHATIEFHQLTFIKLCGVDFNDNKEVSVVTRLIIGAPNLQKLQIKAKLHHQARAPTPCASLGDSFGLPPDFALEKLTDVSLIFVCRYPSGMQLVKFLIESSPVLRSIELQVANYTPVEEVSSEVFWFRRASPSVAITVTLFPSYTSYARTAELLQLSS